MVVQLASSAGIVPNRTAYDRVAYHRYQVRFVAREPAIVPPERLPNMLRGAFDIAFRRLVCHDVDLLCEDCLLGTRCAYPPIFRPSPPAGSSRLSKQSDLPRPFVFEPPSDTPRVLEPGSPLDVGLVLFGTADDALPYFMVALRELAARGLGPTRAKLSVDTVALLAPDGTHTVFSALDNSLRPEGRAWRTQDLVRPGDDVASVVRIDFLTPMTLKRNGRVVERPSFSDVVRRLRDRLSTVAAFFGDGPLELDFAGLGAAADEVRAVHVCTDWVRRTRRSSRSGDVHETSGFVGHAVYEGELGEFMPLLRNGELLHVGKYAVWGNGRVGVRVVEVGR